MEKKIVQVQERTPQLLRQLLKVWESGCFSTVLKLINIQELTVNEQNPPGSGFFMNIWGFQTYKKNGS